LSSLLGDLELDRSLGLLLHHYGPMKYASALGEVFDSKTHQVTAAEFAIDRQIEQCKVSQAFGQLQSNSDCPDLLQLQRLFLTE
jgi:hypothetical protein